MKYEVILTEDGRDCVVERYDNLDKAKQYLENYLYWASYHGLPQGLHINENGMVGVGYDGLTEFTYTIRKTK